MNTNKSKAKILVIDDDPDFLKVVSMMLESGDYTVLTAKNPQEGKKKLFSEKPDLILLDIMMDSLFDGYSLCNDIKSSEEYDEFREIPVIFCSAVKERTGSRFNLGPDEQSLAGPDDYIDKPVRADDLFAQIEKLLKK